MLYRAYLIKQHDSIKQSIIQGDKKCGPPKKNSIVN